MDVEARDALRRKIHGSIGIGIAWRRLAKDLEGREKPLRVTYADLAALETQLEMTLMNHSRIAGSTLGEMKEELVLALNNALNKGVLVTQDAARDRAAGR